MNKEELIQELADFIGVESIGVRIILKDILRRFFDSNICIPRGENPHPYHMELHEWAENCMEDLQVYNDMKPDFTLSLLDEYRIKPSEPVYEWQWHYYSISDDKTFLSQDFYTEIEAKECLSKKHKKLEDTKRIRQ